MTCSAGDNTRAKTIPVLIDADAIRERVQQMARCIQRDYRDKEPVLVSVLTGSFVFAADLMRALSLSVRVDFLGVRSYENSTETTGVVQITQDLSRSIEGEDVLIVEDVVDTGLTVSYLLENLRTRAPRSLKLAALLQKSGRRRVDVTIDYLGFSIENVFVVGYGLDHAQRYRNLPYIGVLPPRAAHIGVLPR